MGTVAKIIIPNPPALTPTEDGLQTTGEAYTLHAPLMATEPLAIQAPTGEVLLWVATELYYRDATGEWDVIYGAFPGEYRAEFDDGILVVICDEEGQIIDWTSEKLPSEETPEETPPEEGE